MSYLQFGETVLSKRMFLVQHYRVPHTITMKRRLRTSGLCLCVCMCASGPSEGVSPLSRPYIILTRGEEILVGGEKG